jgi:drug/metabolite transporter (DMT)-like permease
VSQDNQTTAVAVQTSQPSTEQSAFWPEMSLLAVVTIWGINIPVVKVGLDRSDAFVFNAVRLAVSAVVLLFVAYKEGGPLPFFNTAIPRRKLLLYGFLASGIYQLMFVVGVGRTTSGNAALILATMPMWTALLANLILKERLSVLSWCGLATAFVGTMIVALEKGDISQLKHHLLGNACMLCAALSWSGSTVAARPALKHVTPLKLSAFASVTMLPMHLLIALPFMPEHLSTVADYHVWLPILYSGIFSTGMALVLWNFGVRHAGPAHAAVFQNLVPVIAMVSAWLIRGEGASSSQIAGGILIISGLLIMRRGRQS